MKAIVTGHSRGLGEAIAASLMERNIAVLGVSRTPNPALAARFDALFDETVLDLSDPGAVLRWLEAGPLHRFCAGSERILLVNNAGALQPVGPLAAQEPAAVARTVALNVAVPMLLASAVAALEAKEKRVLHISSGAGRHAYPGWSVYCATKAALDQHARAVALDNAGGVRICSLAPGVIDTDMQAEIRATPADRFPLRGRFEELKRSGSLSDAQTAARKVVDYLLGERFGNSPVADVREG